jgi:hypothetical protein
LKSFGGFMPSFIHNFILKYFTMQKFTFPKFKGFTFLAIMFVFSLTYAQKSNNIIFQGKTYEMPENIDTFRWNQMPESARLNNGYIGWVRFEETPRQNVQDLFKQNNLELINYIPNKTYLFFFPENTSINFLKNNGVRSIVPVPGNSKISENLKNPPFENWAMDGNNILVTLQFHENVSAEFVISELANKQIAVKHQYKGSNNIDLSIPNNCLEDLSNISFVKWVELIVAPSVHDDTRGRSLHRASNLDTQTPSGRNYTGVGIGVLCRDDGIVGPHIDFQGRMDNSEASGTGQTHGDGVSGIMAGAGNLNPLMRGMAAGSDLYVVNYQSNFLDSETVNYINDGTVLITNSSYSNGCNDGYTTIARTVDQQMTNLPNLVHVFSAGNSNGSNCGYGAGNQWGNITGGHKQGKNVITTANVFFDGSIVSSSSRGPAHDGRIKPDISANGQNQNSTAENNTYQVFGGTSGAAPGIAGISAQLYQAYSEANSGDLPPAALIKATLLNTANEAGNIGPDYKFGWGIVNALRAAKLIEDERYLSSTVTQGVSNNHTINVPASTKQVRFMVYWSDSPASPGADPALVNDLDLLVTGPTSTTYLPWILDPTPNPATLNNPATNGPDHLNNMEQVLINNPTAGNYTINIDGFNVPVGPQEYFVVYEIISDNLTVTYPNGSESFVPGETESIHWDAINTTGSFVLEYSTNNGTSWTPITTVANTVTNYAWSVPSSITADALIRITNGSAQDVSDERFSIASLVTNVAITQVCPAQASFSWNTVSGAESYDLYLLGEKYMEVAGTSNTNSITVAITDPNAPIWAAVVAKNNTLGWKSRRTIAIYHPGGLLNCSLTTDLAIENNNSPESFNLVCNPGPVTISVNILNSGVNPQSNFEVSYQLDSNPAVSETFTGTINSGQQITYNFTETLDFSSSGNFQLTFNVVIAGDQNTSNNEDQFEFYVTTESTPLDFSETFETNGVPPDGWEIVNPDNGLTWVERSGIIGSNGSTSVTAYVNNFEYNGAGAEDMLKTEIFDLTGSSSAFLTFDLAKAQYSASFSDELRVVISTDCGETFSTIYEKSGSDLATVSGFVTSIWSPTSASDWRTETIDLQDYLGENVLFGFVNITGYGNSTFIDNINMTGLLGVTDNNVSNVSIYPNPATNQVFLKLDNFQYGNVSIMVRNNLGQTLQVLNEKAFNGNSEATINVSNYASGIYFITVKSGDNTTTKKLVIH